MQPHRGWERAESFGDPDAEREAVRTGVTLADLTAQHLVLAQARDLEAWLPAAPEVGRTAVVGNGGPPTRCCRLTADSALFVSTAPVELPPAPATGGYRTDLTSGRTVIGVAGPRSAELLRRATQVDIRDHALPDGACVQTSLMRAPALILRGDRRGHRGSDHGSHRGSVPAYEIFVPRDFGEYVWDALLDAGAPLGVRIAGAAAFEAGAAASQRSTAAFEPGD
jgi:glycine cleavage system aminomethyltransferase T